MKILFITEGYPPTDGGVAISTQRLSRSFTRHGCSVLVVTFDQSKPLTAENYRIVENHEGFQVIRVGPFFRRMTDLTERDSSIARRRVFDQIEEIAHGFKPDVVLSFYAVTPGLMGKYAALSVGVPHIAGIRGSDIGISMFSFRYLSVLREIVESSAQVVCVNHHLRHRFLLAFPGRAQTSSVIENSVDLPATLNPAEARVKRSYLRSTAKWEGASLVLTFIGMLREKKGIATLFRAMLAAADVDVKLLVVGPGLRKEDEASCRENWNALEAQGRVHCTGHMSRDDALIIASEGDVVIMPSLEDGLANGLLEGMAMGMAPIVSDVFKETIRHGVSGWVVPRDDVDALTAAIRDAARSPEKRAAYAAQAREHIATSHHTEREVRAYLDLMQQVVDQRTAAVGSPTAH